MEVGLTKLTSREERRNLVRRLSTKASTFWRSFHVQERNFSHRIVNDICAWRSETDLWMLVLLRKTVSKEDPRGICVFRTISSSVVLNFEKLAAQKLLTATINKKER